MALQSLLLIVALHAGMAGPVLPTPPHVSYDGHQNVSVHKSPALKTKRKSSKTPSTPAVIQDVRVTPYPDHTRVVLDLQRAIAFTQHRQKASNRIVIELQNALLSKTAKAKLTQGELPQDIAITQSNRTAPQSIMISLNLDTISDYKLLPLNRPYRLVVDVYNKIPVEEMQPTTAAEPPPSIIARPPEAARRPLQREIKTIVIDAGHGGKDPGAIGRGGTAEKDVTLKVSLLLRDLLTKQLGTQVVMTRDRDVFVELEDRAKFANKQNADLFVSIHVNAHPQRGTKGLEVYHFGEASDPRALAVAARENGTPIESTGVGVQYFLADLLSTKRMQESLELAWSTNEALVTHLNSHYEVINHGVKTGPFYVLRFTAMPSILAEIAFISNPTEERLMKATPFLTRIAEGIFEGIKAFIHPLQTAKHGIQG
ncbi:N-acetylmuramoyl-L-alanine amidase [Nitrospira sp. Nam74]